jgi:hypothetical protein
MKKNLTISIILPAGVGLVAFCIGFLISPRVYAPTVHEYASKTLSCETSNALDGFDYFSKPVDKSVFEMRTREWVEFISPIDNLSFKYPKNLFSINRENVDSGGIGTYYITLPSTSEFIPLLKIEVGGELPTEEGWSSPEIFNNQNDIDKQLLRLMTGSEMFDHEPCVANLESISSRVLVRTNDGLHLFLKNSIPHYIHASLIISSDAANWDKEWEEELVLILNSIHFKSTQY